MFIKCEKALPCFTVFTRSSLDVFLDLFLRLVSSFLDLHPLVLNFLFLMGLFDFDFLLTLGQSSSRSESLFRLPLETCWTHGGGLGSVVMGSGGQSVGSAVVGLWLKSGLTLGPGLGEQSRGSYQD